MAESDKKFAFVREWWNGLTETQHDLVRFGGIAVVLGLIGLGVYGVMQPSWRTRQHRQAMKQVEQFAAARDYRDMLLALRRAAELAPNDIATWREVAKRLSELGSSEVLVARQNLANLAPNDVSLRLALVTEALRFGELGLARSSLEGVEEAAQRDAAFFRLAAALAIATGRDADLEQALEKLVAVEPKDAVARFDLAAVRLWSTEPAKISAALAELESLVTAPEVRVRAALELLKQAARQRDPARAGQVVMLLVKKLSPNGAAVALTGEPPGWVQLLEGLKSAAASSPADVTLLARWLADVRLTREALVWIDTLAPEVKRAAPVLDVAAELSAGLGDNARLEDLLRDEAWGPMPGDVIALAIASHVQVTRGQAQRAKETWNDAIAACEGSAIGLRALARLADAWKDGPGGERALRILVERWPKTWWAYTTLRARYAERSDLPALWQLYEIWARARPEDPTVVREWIVLCAVLDHVNADVLAKARAQFTSAPEEPAAAMACAAALWRSGRAADADKVLGGIPAEARAKPDVAFWDALVQADLRQRQAAVQALSRGWKDNLPQEYVQLIRAAAEKVNVKLNN